MNKIIQRAEKFVCPLKTRADSTKGGKQAEDPNSIIITSQIVEDFGRVGLKLVNIDSQYQNHTVKSKQALTTIGFILSF